MDDFSVLPDQLFFEVVDESLCHEFMFESQPIFGIDIQFKDIEIVQFLTGYPKSSSQAWLTVRSQGL